MFKMLYWDFAAGVYQSFWTGDTVSHVVIFDPALCNVAPLTFSLVKLSHAPFPLPSVNNRISIDSSVPDS
jgi:hypothetical protein